MTEYTKQMEQKRTIFEAMKMHWRHKKTVRMFLKEYD